MIRHYKKDNLYQDYAAFAAIIVTVVFTLCIFLSISLYHSYHSTLDQSLTAEANRIDRVIADNFDYTNKFLVYIGKQIANHGSGDLQHIYHLFQQNISDGNDKGLFSWSLYDWVDNNNRQLVNSKSGIAKNPPD